MYPSSMKCLLLVLPFSLLIHAFSGFLRSSCHRLQSNNRHQQSSSHSTGCSWARWGHNERSARRTSCQTYLSPSIQICQPTRQRLDDLFHPSTNVHDAVWRRVGNHRHEDTHLFGSTKVARLAQAGSLRHNLG